MPGQSNRLLAARPLQCRIGPIIPTLGRRFPGASHVFPCIQSRCRSTRGVPAFVRRPAYAEEGIRGQLARCVAALRTDFGWHIDQKSPADVQAMRHAGMLAREVLDTAGHAIRPGMTTMDIDEIVHNAAVDRNVYPSPLRYRGFAASCCTSVNEVVAHGIPGARPVQEGDLVNVDVTVYTADGFHGDCSETFYVGSMTTEPNASGETSTDSRSSSCRLARTAHDALMAGVAACRPGVPFYTLGGIIEDVITAQGFKSVREFCGHGIGRDFHSSPRIWHYRHTEWPFFGEGVMLPGHTFTIEPMVAEGSADVVELDDGWTVATADGLRSAQFEHTLLVTETGVEVLTARLPSSPRLCWEHSLALNSGDVFGLACHGDVKGSVSLCG